MFHVPGFDLNVDFHTLTDGLDLHTLTDGLPELPEFTAHGVTELWNKCCGNDDPPSSVVPEEDGEKRQKKEGNTGNTAGRSITTEKTPRPPGSPLFRGKHPAAQKLKQKMLIQHPLCPHSREIPSAFKKENRTTEEDPVVIVGGASCSSSSCWNKCCGAEEFMGEQNGEEGKGQENQQNTVSSAAAGARWKAARKAVKNVIVLGQLHPGNSESMALKSEMAKMQKMVVLASGQKPDYDEDQRKGEKVAAKENMVKNMVRKICEMDDPFRNRREEADGLLLSKKMQEAQAWFRVHARNTRILNEQLGNYDVYQREEEKPWMPKPRPNNFSTIDNNMTRRRKKNPDLESKMKERIIEFSAVPRTYVIQQALSPVRRKATLLLQPSISKKFFSEDVVTRPNDDEVNRMYPEKLGLEKRSEDQPPPPAPTGEGTASPPASAFDDERFARLTRDLQAVLKDEEVLDLREKRQTSRRQTILTASANNQNQNQNQMLFYGEKGDEDEDDDIDTDLDGVDGVDGVSLLFYPEEKDYEEDGYTISRSRQHGMHYRGGVVSRSATEFHLSDTRSMLQERRRILHEKWGNELEEKLNTAKREFRAETEALYDRASAWIGQVSFRTDPASYTEMYPEYFAAASSSSHVKYQSTGQSKTNVGEGAITKCKTSSEDSPPKLLTNDYEIALKKQRMRRLAQRMRRLAKQSEKEKRLQQASKHAKGMMRIAAHMNMMMPTSISKESVVVDSEHEQSDEQLQSAAIQSSSPRCFSSPANNSNGPLSASMLLNNNRSSTAALTASSAAISVSPRGLSVSAGGLSSSLREESIVSPAATAAPHRSTKITKITDLPGYSDFHTELSALKDSIAATNTPKGKTDTITLSRRIDE